jgi:hypothetical protein
MKPSNQSLRGFYDYLLFTFPLLEKKGELNSYSQMILRTNAEEAKNPSNLPNRL